MLNRFLPLETADEATSARKEQRRQRRLARQRRRVSELVGAAGAPATASSAGSPGRSPRPDDSGVEGRRLRWAPATSSPPLSRIAEEGGDGGEDGGEEDPAARWAGFHNTYENNPKGLLQEVLNAAAVGFNQNDIKYTPGRSTNEADVPDPDWLCLLTIGKCVAVRARGSSKKDASRRAAQLALDSWDAIHRKLAGKTTAAMCEIIEGWHDPPREAPPQRGPDPPAPAAEAAHGAYSDEDEGEGGMMGLSGEEGTSSEEGEWEEEYEEGDGDDGDDGDEVEADLQSPASLYEFAGRLMYQALVIGQQAYVLDQRTRKEKERAARDAARRQRRRRVAVPARREAGRRRRAAKRASLRDQIIDLCSDPETVADAL